MLPSAIFDVHKPVMIWFGLLDSEADKVVDFMVDHFFVEFPYPGSTPRVKADAKQISNSTFVLRRDTTCQQWLDDNYRGADSIDVGSFEIVRFDEPSSAVEFKLRWCV